jgi:hypothetical protein
MDLFPRPHHSIYMTLINKSQLQNVYYMLDAVLRTSYILANFFIKAPRGTFHQDLRGGVLSQAPDPKTVTQDPVL